MVRQKRSLTVLLLVGVMALSACKTQATATPAASTTATVARGSLQAKLAAAGTVAAQAQVSVPFQTSGQVTAVTVKVGDAVKAGQVLASLDTATLEMAVASAQASLEAAQADLASAQKGPLDSKIQAAEAALTSAQAALRAAQNEAAHQSDQLTIEQADLDSAAQRLSDAQGTYSNLIEYKPSGATGRGAPYVPPAGEEWSTQKAALDNAQIDYQVAVANYKLAAVQVNDSSVQSAAAKVASAQADLDSLKSTPDTKTVQLAQIAVEQAQIALDQAKLSLSHAHLAAPFDGVVAALSLQVGQQISSGTAALTLADLSHLQVEVNVSETDLPSLKVGQSAQVTFDALTDQTLTGKVTQIALVGTTSSGVVNYPVVVTLDQAGDQVRPGMSATLSIVVEQRDNVLLVPNRAVKTSGKNKTVTLVQDGQSTTVNVTLGLSGDTQSEVTGGLSEGDQVAVQQTTTTTSGQGAGGPGLGILGGPGMGAGGPPPGG